MKRILRVLMSIMGSIVLSMLASWALRRLLLWSSNGGMEPGEKRSVPMVVVMPVVAGNTWVFGQPKQIASPPGQGSET